MGGRSSRMVADAALDLEPDELSLCHRASVTLVSVARHGAAGRARGCHRDDVRRLQRWRGGRALPVRRGRRRAAGPPAAPHLRRVARPRRRRRAGHPLRLPRARTVGPVARAPLQRGQAAARPLRPRHRRPAATSTTPCSATRPPTATTPSATTATPRRSCRGRSSSPTASTGRATRPPQVALVGHGHLRAARARLHAAAPRRPARAARARTPGWPTRPSSSTCAARGHHRRADAGAPVRQRAVPDPPRPRQLLGLQLGRASSRRTPTTRPAARAASRSPSSSRWSARCTPPASRSSSTSSTTTPAKAASTGRPCAGAAWTTPPTTGCATAAATRTSPAAATRWTCGTRAACRWSPTRCATGSRRCTSTASGSTSRRHWRGGRTRSTPAAPSSRWSARTRCSREVKLIAEPWDVGPGGYQLGHFPPPWAEWNDRYRDAVRDVWLADNARKHGSGVRDLAYRLTGSSDVFGGIGPRAARLGQLRHRPRRLHAARPRHLRAQAQREQRRGQPRRPRPQPQLELRGRGPDRPAGRRGRCAAG